MRLVILCGGSGTRLWPISRTSSPKQFIPLFNGKSLFELTIERNLKHFENLTVVVNEEQLDICRTQVPKSILSKTIFIIEPIGRNTAPAISLAALASPDDDLLVVPSDHLIEDPNIYQACLEQAGNLAKENRLVTFGLKPSYPETGFGYIESDGTNVLSFKEKPNLELATTYIEKGNFFWNSGMFYFKASFYLSELKEYSSEIFSASQTAFSESSPENGIYRISQELMQKIPSDSIDYAIMEKSKYVSVVPSSFKWSDLGSFDALDKVLPKDDLGNTQDSNYISFKSNNNLILSSKRLIATFDIDDLIIVDTPDALLIGKKGESQHVKDLLAQVKAKNEKLLK